MAEAASTEQAGISRQSIAGLFDASGNPAALASGWLVNVCPGSRKLHRYAVLTPTFLAFFNSEDHAAINEDGFMTGESGRAALDPYSTIGYQLDLYAIGKSASEAEKITLRTAGDAADEANPMLSRDVDGSLCLVLECASAEIAEGWLGAIQGQVPHACDITPPPRTRPALVGAASSAPTSGSVARATPTAALKKQDSLMSRLGGLLLSGSSGAAGGDSTAPMVDDDYVVYEPWAARKIDLMSKAGRKHLSDAAGHPAAVMHGWLTKRNKSGLTSGKVDKDRYFVLTPQALAFFTDDRAANVSPDGFMLGKAEGERTGFLGRTGAALSLEAICAVRLMALSGGAVASSVYGAGRGSAADDAADDNVETEDVSTRRSRRAESRRRYEEDAGRESSTSSMGARRSAGCSGTGGGHAEADEYDAGSEQSLPGGAPFLSTLFSVDFGEYSLVCNAHNQACRVAWVQALRRWSAWRKKALDQQMLAAFGKTA